MIKKEDSAICGLEGNQFIRVICPTCGEENIFEIEIPEFSNNYENESDSEVSEDEQRDCENDECDEIFEITKTNGSGGFTIQIVGIEDSEIEYL